MADALMFGPTGRLEELQLAARTAAERERAADQSALSHPQRGCENEAHVPYICQPAPVVTGGRGWCHAGAGLALSRRQEVLVSEGL